MAEYEVVREVQNLCGNNQMRDVFFAEIETNDPVSWVRGFLKGKDVELTVDEKENGDLTVYAGSGGVSQKFLMTRIWVCRASHAKNVKRNAFFHIFARRRSCNCRSSVIR